MRSTGARYVLVPTLDDLGRHPAVRAAVLARLGRLLRATAVVGWISRAHRAAPAAVVGAAGVQDPGRASQGIDAR